MARVKRCYSCFHHPHQGTLQCLLSQLQRVPGKAWSSWPLVEGEGDWEGDMKKVMAWLRLQIFSLFVCLFTYKPGKVSKQKGKAWRWSATGSFQGAASRWNEYGGANGTEKDQARLLGQMPTCGKWCCLLILFTPHPISSYSQSLCMIQKDKGQREERTDSPKVDSHWLQ